MSFCTSARSRYVCSVVPELTVTSPRCASRTYATTGSSATSVDGSTSAPSPIAARAIGGAAAIAAAPVAAPAIFMNERLLRRSMRDSFPAASAAVWIGRRSFARADGPVRSRVYDALAAGKRRCAAYGGNRGHGASGGPEQPASRMDASEGENETRGDKPRDREHTATASALPPTTASSTRSLPRSASADHAVSSPQSRRSTPTSGAVPSTPRSWMETATTYVAPEKPSAQPSAASQRMRATTSNSAPTARPGA